MNPAELADTIRVALEVSWLTGSELDEVHDLLAELQALAERADRLEKALRKIRSTALGLRSYRGRTVLLPEAAMIGRECDFALAGVPDLKPTGDTE